MLYLLRMAQQEVNDQLKINIDLILSLFIAPPDYTSVSTNVTFLQDTSSNRSMCENISVLNDSNAENTENFMVIIAVSTSDPTVSISPNGGVANVNLVDSTGKV